MWQRTEAARKLGIEYPIVQGPFGGGLSSVKLAAAVSNAGGLGSFGAHNLTPSQIVETTAELRKHTRKPFAVNLWVQNEDPAVADFTQKEFDRHLARLQPYFAELGLAPPEHPNRFGESFETQVAALIDACPPVFSFVFGIPSAAVLDACRSRGILTAGTATTAEEATALETAGVDIVVATGFEAGGHRVSFLKSAEDSLTGTFALIPLVRDAVKVPVIAAGGIVNGRGVAAALALGADGVQVGTAFLACQESSASQPHRDALFSAAARDTVLTRAFSGRLARGIRNRLSEDLARHAGDFAPYPVQVWLTGSFKAAAIAQGKGDLISLWAGQIAPLLRQRHAEELFNDLVRETEETLLRVIER